MEVVLGMNLLNFSNIDVQFAEKELIWRTYTIEKALSTTCQVKLIDWKEFANTRLDKSIKAFVMHISSLKLRITIHLARKAQIALLLAKKVTRLAKYSDFADIFSEELGNILLKQTKANKHAIKLKKDK